MKKTNLYRYHGEDGTVDTPILLPMDHELRLRIEADEGMLLTNGEITTTIYDIPAGDIDAWMEIPEIEEIPETEEIPENEGGDAE